MKDIAAALVLGVLAAALSLAGFAAAREALPLGQPPHVVHDDIWFDGDLDDILQRATLDVSEQHLTSRHPLFSLLIRMPVRRAMHLWPAADPASLFGVLLAAAAAAGAALMFVALRTIGCAWLDAVLFALVAIVSGAATFWFTVPETFAFGAVSMLPAVILAAAGRQARPREWLTTACAAVSGLITITNLMVGFFAAWTLHGARRAMQVTVNALAIIVLLWAVQHAIYETTSFLLVDATGYRPFMLTTESRTPFAPLKVLLLDTMIVSDVGVRREGLDGISAALTVQRVWPSVGGPAGLIGLLAWVLVLAAGSTVVRGMTPPVRQFLLATLAGQVALHVVLGSETFLYTMHVLPILVVIAAASTIEYRRLGRAAAVVLIVCAALNNFAMFGRCLALVRRGLDLS